MGNLPWSHPDADPLADINTFAADARERHYVNNLDEGGNMVTTRLWLTGDPEVRSVTVTQEEFNREERRHQEWLEFESAALNHGVCPHSGEVLHRGGEAGPTMLSCDMCDCFGYDPDEVPNPVDPLTCDSETLYHWKGWLRTCGCPPEAYHAHDCTGTPIYAEIMAEGWLDTRPLEMNQRYWPLHWICVGLGGVEPHRGADINGPTHWCEREKRVVSQDEW